MWLIPGTYKNTLQIAEFTKDASEKWKALPSDKKRPFEAAAAEDKKRYEREVCVLACRSVKTQYMWGVHRYDWVF